MRIQAEYEERGRKTGEERGGGGRKTYMREERRSRLRERRGMKRRGGQKTRKESVKEKIKGVNVYVRKGKETHFSIVR